MTAGLAAYEAERARRCGVLDALEHEADTAPNSTVSCALSDAAKAVKKVMDTRLAPSAAEFTEALGRLGGCTISTLDGTTFMLEED